MGLELDKRGNISTPNGKYRSTNPKVFAAGDARRGQSLVVWAIAEGREAAREIDEFLTGKPSQLKARDASLIQVGMPVR
jgi:NADPH-dependent glutamate synthase beta subunit-like oxidoreductase